MLDHEDQSREIEGQSAVPYAFVQQSAQNGKKSKYLGPDGVSNWDYEWINNEMTPETFPRSANPPAERLYPTDKTFVSEPEEVVGPDMVGYRVHDFVNDNIDIFQAPRK
jgi:hypothetical protein